MRRKTIIIIAAALLGAATARAGKLSIQPFEGLEASSMGVYMDAKGSKMDISLKEEGKGQALQLAYELKLQGWGGFWARTGADWKGQDWSGAKAVSLRVHSSEPVVLDFLFLDAHQNSYVARLPRTQGKGWETLKVRLYEFQLNPGYRPPEAKEGADLDLSRVGAFNITVQTLGKHSLLFDDVTLEK